MPAWVQTDTRAIPDASADIADLTPGVSWICQTQPPNLRSDNLENPPGASWPSDQSVVRFRVVRVPEGNQTQAEMQKLPVRAESPKPKAKKREPKAQSPMTNRDRELGMDRAITRRDFLNGVAIGLGSMAGEFFADELRRQALFEN